VVRNAPRIEAKPTRPALNYIPAGRFLMGSPTSEPGHKRDESLRTVILTRPVFMAETPVTQAHYEAVVGRNPSRAPGKHHPVERVKWLEAALDYCNALSKLEGLTPAYVRRGNQVRLVEGAMGYRLPTEAQWEYACRAGQGGPYPGDDDSCLDATAWYVANSKRRSHPVGEKAPNGWGLFDMRGNVWEWCSDLYGRLLVGPATDPTGATLTQRREGGELETRRVRRGGSFDNRPLFLRAAHRMRSEPHEVFNNVGFRVVRPIAD
jgi:formylglycine-generating enzyme required for sulfatase activity